MKIVFISLSTATLLGLAFFLGSFSFDAGVFISDSFVVALLAWTISQYCRKPRPLAITRPIYPPARLIHPEPQTTRNFTRLAA